VNDEPQEKQETAERGPDFVAYPDPVQAGAKAQEGKVTQMKPADPELIERMRQIIIDSDPEIYRQALEHTMRELMQRASMMIIQRETEAGNTSINLNDRDLLLKQLDDAIADVERKLTDLEDALGKLPDRPVSIVGGNNRR